MTGLRVFKLGGELLDDPAHLSALASAIAAAPGPLVVVHGGGREIDRALARAGIAKRQVDGLRVTDDATLQVVVEVLAGAVNTRFVTAIVQAGGRAVGLTGADAGLVPVIKARAHRAVNGEVVDLGHVGQPSGTGRPDLALDLARGGYVPVVASVAASSDGALYNVNADTMAADLAARLGAEVLVIAGTTAGVLDEAGRTIATLDAGAAEALITSGVASAGMIAKLTACRDAVTRGVGEVLLLDGRDVQAVAAALGATRSERTTMTRMANAGDQARMENVQ